MFELAGLFLADEEEARSHHRKNVRNRADGRCLVQGSVLGSVLCRFLLDPIDIRLQCSSGQNPRRKNNGKGGEAFER